MVTESEARKAQELTAIVQEIRERVRARYPEGQIPGLEVPVPDLVPVLHARDAAEGKVAAIGGVNPRPPGVLNSAIQFFKRQVARTLGWFVRDQIDFNRAVISSLDATLEALNEFNRTFKALGGSMQAMSDEASHWKRWREEWEKKLLANEIHYLRSLTELHGSIEHRISEAETSFRESTRTQHSDFTASLNDVQRRLWADLEKVRLEYEALIHNELRVARQRLETGRSVSAPVARASFNTEPSFGEGFDYTRFADRFRGSEEYVRQNQRFYLPYFEGRTNVLDIGCGRGELLALFKEAGVGAKGIDLDAESVALCRARGYHAEVADLYQYLPQQPDGAFDGIVASQVVEHLLPARVPELIRLAASKLQKGGLLALETPNPECLAIFATHFYLDPTHTRPLPSQLLSFYMEEAGIGRIEVHRLSPAHESMPVLNELPPGFREAFFGGLDYAIFGRKL